MRNDNQLREWTDPSASPETTGCRANETVIFHVPTVQQSESEYENWAENSLLLIKWLRILANGKDVLIIGILWISNFFFGHEPQDHFPKAAASGCV